MLKVQGGLGGGPASAAGGGDFLSSCIKALTRDATPAAAASSTGITASSAARERDAARRLSLMQLLVNVAAHPDGQRALLQAPSLAAGSLELVVALAEPPTGAPKPPTALVERGLLLLRNLCFAPESKAHVLAHPRLLSMLLTQVEGFLGSRRECVTLCPVISRQSSLPL
jgi:hypothetical protein